MNPLKKLIYNTSQIVIGVPLLVYACLRYRDVHDYDAFAFRFGDWLTKTFLESEPDYNPDES